MNDFKRIPEFVGYIDNANLDSFVEFIMCFKNSIPMYQCVLTRYSTESP